MSLIFLVFCVVFCGGVRVAHLFRGQTIREDQNGTFSDDSVNIGKLISTKTKCT